MRTHFTAHIRVLLCESCGAPLEAPLGGGPVACAYCRAQNVIATRDERPTLGMPAVPQPIDENTRLMRLRSQDGKPMLPPPSIAYLLSGSSFDPSKVQEAFMVYQATRKELKATHSPDAAERLYFLTLVASNYLTEQNDPARRRAILETSLDSLFLPRHKQAMRCQLASAAAKEGDIAAAEQWLAPCDARSDDLDSDSAWRTCRAFVDTVKGDWRAVIAVLGAVDEQIPIADARDPLAAVLRANALERMGDVNGAVNALRSRMSNENAAGRAAIESIVRSNPQLQLCGQSMPIATQGHAQEAAKVASSGAGGGVGLVLMVIGGGLLLLAIALVVIPAIGGVLFALRNGADVGAMLGSVLTGLPMGIGPLIAGVVMTPLGFALWNGAREAAFMRMHGIQARGVVRNVQATGTRINNVPMMRVNVQVMRDGVAPYEASFTQLMPPGLLIQLTPGTQVPLRVHPQKPDKMILELQ
jgi:LSD1 subclass zinc finger protein